MNSEQILQRDRNRAKYLYVPGQVDSPEEVERKRIKREAFFERRRLRRESRMEVITPEMILAAKERYEEAKKKEKLDNFGVFNDGSVRLTALDALSSCEKRVEEQQVEREIISTQQCQSDDGNNDVLDVILNDAILEVNTRDDSDVEIRLKSDFSVCDNGQAIGLGEIGPLPSGDKEIVSDFSVLGNSQGCVDEDSQQDLQSECFTSDFVVLSNSRDRDRAYVRHLRNSDHHLVYDESTGLVTLTMVKLLAYKIKHALDCYDLPGHYRPLDYLVNGRIQGSLSSIFYHTYGLDYDVYGPILLSRIVLSKGYHCQRVSYVFRRAAAKLRVGSDPVIRTNSHDKICDWRDDFKKYCNIMSEIVVPNEPKFKVVDMRQIPYSTLCDIDISHYGAVLVADSRHASVVSGDVIVLDYPLGVIIAWMGFPDGGVVTKALRRLRCRIEFVPYYVSVADRVYLVDGSSSERVVYPVPMRQDDYQMSLFLDRKIDDDDFGFSVYLDSDVIYRILDYCDGSMNHTFSMVNKLWNSLLDRHVPWEGDLSYGIVSIRQDDGRDEVSSVIGRSLLFHYGDDYCFAIT